MRLQTTVNGINVAYDVDGEGPPFLFLHGWAANAQSFLPVYRMFSQWFRVIAIDLPGFGESEPPPGVWGVDEYADLVYCFLRQVSVEKAHVMGHSFGAKITIQLAAKHPEIVDKITLVGSTGVKPKRPLKYYLKVYTFKACKKLYNVGLLGPRSDERLQKLHGTFGSKDYRDAGPMRDVLVRQVNQFVEDLMPSIRSSTLLMWGENDTDTPVRDGKIMESLIPDAGLVVLSDAGHFCYLDQLGAFNKIVKHFYLQNSS